MMGFDDEETEEERVGREDGELRRHRIAVESNRLFAKYGVGSQQRFHLRAFKWKQTGRPMNQAKHMFWWITHNIPAHLAIAILPMFRWPFRFHDWTSAKLNRPD